MSALLIAALPPLRAPWQWRLNQSSARVRWAGALVLVLTLCLVGVFKGWLAGAVSAGIAAGGLAVTAWLVTLSGLMRLNHPMLARLQPGHVARLRAAALLLWGVPVVLAGGVAAGLEANTWAVMLKTGVGLSLLSVFVRWPLTFVLVWFVPPAVVPLWQASALTQALGRVAESMWAGSAALVCLGVLAALALFQASLIGTGDAAHRRRHERLQRVLSSLQSGNGGFNPRAAGRWGLWWNRRFCALTNWTLDRLVRAPQPTPSHALARLEYPLYGSAHWTMLVGALAIVLPMIGLGMVTLGLLVPQMSWSQGPWQHIPGHWWLLGAGQLFMGTLTGMLFNVGIALERSRKEQALLVLLPGVPSLGRLQADLLRRQGLWMLALAVPGLLLLGFAAVPTPGVLLQGFGVGMVVASLLLLRPWAVQRTPGSFAILAVSVGVAMAWLLLLPEAMSQGARLALTAGVVLVTVGLWALGLRRMRRAERPGLPVARCAR